MRYNDIKPYPNYFFLLCRKLASRVWRFVLETYWGQEAVTTLWQSHMLWSEVGFPFLLQVLNNFFQVWRFSESFKVSVCPKPWYDSPLWKWVMAWVESNCPRDCGIVWGDAECDDNSQRPPKPSHNHLGNYSRPRLSLFFKVGYYQRMQDFVRKVCSVENKLLDSQSTTMKLFLNDLTVKSFIYNHVLR